MLLISRKDRKMMEMYKKELGVEYENVKMMDLVEALKKNDVVLKDWQNEDYPEGWVVETVNGEVIAIYEDGEGYVEHICIE